MGLTLGDQLIQGVDKAEEATVRAQAALEGQGRSPWVGGGLLEEVGDVLLTGLAL